MRADMNLLAATALACFRVIAASSANSENYLSAYTVPGAFPTSVFASYYNDPTATSAQVQPVISDPVTHNIFPETLTDPENFPKNDTVDPHPLPPKASGSQLLKLAVQQIQSITNNSVFGNDTCAQCLASLEVAKFLVSAAPEQGPDLAVELCELFDYSSTCAVEYARTSIGAVLAQVVYFADVGGYDGQLICASQFNLCPMPATSPLNLTGWFAKPKPNPLPPPKQPSGERLKVLHLSDVHIDPRYATGSEANCTGYMCCRDNVFNSQSPNATVFPAPRFGAYLCDTPLSLLASAMEAIGPLTGTEESGFAFSLFTGDLTAHDSDNQYSRAFVEYSEIVIYEMFKRFLGPAPVYATVGNHDTYNQFQMSPYSIGGYLKAQYNWLYDHISSLWAYEGWLPEESLEFARTHYAGYTVKRTDGLRIISLDTNLWYTLNYFSYVNATEPDMYGIFRVLTDDLQDAEDAGDRVWLIGHVLSGWDGYSSQMNPTNLFYQIVDRFSPHVIANIFYGHTHEDQLSIFYANNGTVMSADTAQVVSWIGPSITPLENLNSGFRVYEVDSATFDIIDSHTWKSSVNEFPALDSQTQVGPTYEYEYSARQAYGRNITWGENDPLNATWWHLVTEQMELNPSLVQTFNTYQGKSSVMTAPCTGDCIPAKICYMRSGSASLSLQNCIPNYGSVQ
ncbi:sphingomyelin phosphodiesterase [Leucogyrophana mollusca]|uniref:Sphingomyelin phosphodiesterase n=1 Tax=Leucogyrophana mollusca TaxID=85980 RepID=A0ACB8AY51_9AGAM|nr:sphingomyelin phosphodiesterase [Leucogyrophana mollusca]